jgi:hypothetical protein
MSGHSRPAVRALSLWFGLAALSCSVADAAPPVAGPTGIREVASGPVCPSVLPTTKEGQLQDDQVDEASGLVASHKNPGVYWVHNDSGDSARAFALDGQGRALARLELSNVDANDIEDIALARGKAGAPDMLYLADTGNNIKRHPTVQLYRVAEPLLDLRKDHVTVERAAEEFEVRYEDGKHDAETLLVDPESGDLFLVAKSHLLLREELVGVYRIAASELRAGKPATARKVATIALGPTTGGDIAPDGSAIMVRNYWSAMYWPRAPGESVGQAMSRPGCRLPVSDVAHQGESLAFSADGKAYLTVPEGSHPTIYRYAFER